MRLTHQLNLFIITLLIFVLLGMFYINVNSSRDYLLREMQSQTQDAATILAVKLAPSLQAKDDVLMAVTASAIFDRGHYQSVVIKTMAGATLYEQTIPVVVEGVPSWFVNLLTIESPVGTGIIQDKWQQLASLRLVAHPGHAYAELWNVAVSSLSWLLVLGVIAFSVLWGIIQVVLRPLHAVEKQAGQISQQNFSYRPRLPKTPELRELVMAMNSMAEKIEHFLLEQTRRANRLREKIYHDKTTGLLNRNGFEMRVNDLLQNKSESIQGYLLLIRLEGLEQVNEQRGYEHGNVLLKQFVKQLQVVSKNEWELARMSGKDFIVLVPGYHSENIEVVCEQTQLFISDSQAELGFYTAAISFESGQSWPDLLSLADTALSHALKSSTRWSVLTSSEVQSLPRLSATEWREKLLDDIESNAIILRSQICVDADKQELHREILLLTEYNGTALPTAVVLSIAQRYGLAEALDRYVLRKVIALLSTTSLSYAVNITPVSLIQSSFLSWLASSLRQHGIEPQRLILEIKEQSLLQHRDLMVDALKEMGSRKLYFAFDGVGAEKIIFSELEGIVPKYIKLDGHYSLAIDSNADHQSMVENILLLAHTKSIAVIAQHVETREAKQALLKLGVDGVQGYYSAKPINIEMG